MTVTLDEKINSRIQFWGMANNQPPEVFIHEAIEQSLDDWEDYMDALNICSEIDAGKMKTYSLDEVERQLDELNALEGRENSCFTEKKKCYRVYHLSKLIQITA